MPSPSAGLSLPVPALGAILLALALPGCAHHEPGDRAVEQLRADLVKVQAERDRFEGRLEALEAAHDRRERETKRSAGGSFAEGRGAAPETVPRLPVVRVGEEPPPALAPSDGEVSEVGPDSGDVRPVVQANGVRSPAERRRRGRNGGEPSPSSLTPEARRDYDAALGLVRAKQYEKGLEALTAFLVRYPDHPYADNAMYWRGECFYAKGEFARAAEQFDGLIARFPYGNKAPDALLKLGLSQERLGSKDQAQKTFAELRGRYPKSDAVRQAPR